MLSLALSGRGGWGEGRGRQGECSLGLFAPSGACVQTWPRCNGRWPTLFMPSGTCVQTMFKSCFRAVSMVFAIRGSACWYFFVVECVMRRAFYVEPHPLGER